MKPTREAMFALASQSVALVATVFFRASSSSSCALVARRSCRRPRGVTPAAQRRRGALGADARALVQEREPCARLRREVLASGGVALLPDAEALAAVADGVLVQPALAERVVSHDGRVVLARPEDGRRGVLRNGGVDRRRDVGSVVQARRARVHRGPDGKNENLYHLESSGSRGNARRARTCEESKGPGRDTATRETAKSGWRPVRKSAAVRADSMPDRAGSGQKSAPRRRRKQLVGQCRGLALQRLRRRKRPSRGSR